MRPNTVVVLAALLAAAAVPARAQVAPAAGAAEGDTRYFDYFVSRLRPADGGGSELGAVGGRLMWPLAGVAGEGWTASLHRAAVGGFLTHAPAEPGDPELWRYGAQADLPLVAQPLAGRIDPVLSLAVGAVRVRTPGGAQLPDADEVPPLLTSAVVVPPRTDHDLSLAPGLGARVRLLPGLDLRGDARQVMDIGDGEVRRQLELSAGLSVRRMPLLR